MRVIVIVASDTAAGAEHRLLTGDRAAVAWGVALADNNCRVHCDAHDVRAITYARAAGAQVAYWDGSVESEFDAAVIGPGAIQHFGDVLAGRLAEEGRAELLFDALRLERSPDGWQVVCAAGRGERDIVTVTGPVVVVVSQDAPRPAYVSQYRLQRAAVSDPDSVLHRDGKPWPSGWGPVTPRTPRAVWPTAVDAQARADHVFGITQRSETSERVVIDEDPRTAAKLLFRYLVHRGFVSRRLPAEPADVLTARTEPATAEPADARRPGGPTDRHQIPPAILRGPRHRTDSPDRRRRRPRPASAIRTASGSLRRSENQLRRGPRRLHDPTPPGRRGPFGIGSDSATTS